MQKLLRHMQAALSSNDEEYRMTNMIQNIIYFFNQPPIRDYVIELHKNILPIGKKIIWDGTYFFNEKGTMDPYHHPDIGNDVSLTNFLKNRDNYQNKKSLFVLATCCVTYEGNKVHFLSLIYDRKNRMLIFFDPGIHLYEKGQDVAVPIVKNAFINTGLIDNTKNIERIGLCSSSYHGKKMGIQYNGEDPAKTRLPADSFCQSWTLYYLVEFLHNQCTDKFFSSWCSIPPPKRETFILTNFFIPHLRTHSFLYKKWRAFYPEGDMTKLNQYTIRQTFYK